MEEFIADWVAGVMITFQESYSEVANLLGRDLQSNTNMWGMVSDIHTIISPICYTIIVIFFLIEFLKMSMKMDMLKWEYLFKIMAKFVIAKACIDFGLYFMEAIYSTVAEWTTTFGTSSYDPSIYTDIMKAINDELKDCGFWNMIGFALTSILNCIVIEGCALILKVIAYGRMIEIYVLLAFMPIPFAFLLDGEGHTNTTKKYIMNFAGVCLQGLLMIVASSLYQYLMADVIAGMGGSGSAGDLLFNLMLSSIIMVMAVSKCGQWGKQIVGAM